MNYKECSYYTNTEATDIVVAFINEYNFGVIIEDSSDLTREFADRFGEIYQLNAADYPESGVRIKFYVPENNDGQASLLELQTQITSLPMDLAPDYWEFSEVAATDWDQYWKADYQPIHLSPRVVVSPSWIDYTPVTDEVMINIDPKMAFGTGSHETTQLCAQLLDDYVTSQEVVIDVGTGTGILAIIAKKLGASTVFANDLDQVAVDTAIENMGVNHVDIAVVKADKLADIAVEPTMIVANIVYDVIMMLIPQVKAKLPVGGSFITSGLNEEQGEAIADQLQQAGFIIVEHRLLNGWAGIIAEKL
ncbi:MAG: 50S ribosomal protein L11 methyltransferase [Culicoidibacterales bacterium]